MPLCARHLRFTALLRDAARLTSSPRAPARCLVRLFTCCTPRHARGHYEQRPYPSQRHLRSRRSSPSKALISVLQEHAQHHALPSAPPPGKIDISYMNIGKNDRERLLQERERQRLQTGRRAKPARLSLQTIAAKAIERRLADSSLCDVDHANHSNIPFTEQELALLASRNYTLQDVEDWVDILVDEDTTRAAKRLLDHDAPVNQTQPNSDKKPIPPVVFLFFLRRPLHGFSSEALSFAIMHAWHELRRKRTIQEYRDGVSTDEAHMESYRPEYPTMTDSSVMIMIVRLLRYARGVWPESLITISHMFTGNFYIPTTTQPAPHSLRLKKNRNASIARLATLYNRILSLIARPCTVAPFLSTPHRQKAQFHVLRKMAEHDPPLTVGREGYRAVVSVHLASKKTDREREWDELKARSWPPWKVDRTGIDEEKGPEYGVSAALQAMRHASNAGYGIGNWEKVAHVLSGWDIDDSPTIQTRAILLPKYARRQTLLQQYQVTSRGTDRSPDTWAARIRATRTVQEAWACFLIYENLTLKQDIHDKKSLPVYQALLEKLAANTVKPDDSTSEDTFSTRTLNAGDSQEVFPTPESPKDATYVRTEPPTLDELANEMFTLGPHPEGRMIELLVSKAQTLGQGLRYLRWAAKHNPGIASLLDPASEAKDDLKVPRRLFVAVIKFLCRFSKSTVGSRTFRSRESGFGQGESALAFAQGLLKAYKPTYQLPYLWVLRTLAVNDRTASREHSPESDEQRREAAKSALERHFIRTGIMENMRSMNLGTTAETFRLECYGLESAIVAALQILEGSSMRETFKSDNVVSNAQSKDNAQTQSSHIVSNANDILHLSGPRMRSHFYELMNGSSTYQSQLAANYMPTASLPTTHKSRQRLSIPRLLTTPYPSILHNYIRMLGVLRDHDGLLALAEWMSTYRKEIGAAASEPRGGQNVLRKCLIALRVFVEGAGLDSEKDDTRSATGSLRDSKEPTRLAAPMQLRQRMQALVESLPDKWGGWPSDDEVERYCQHDDSRGDDAGDVWDKDDVLRIEKRRSSR